MIQKWPDQLLKNGDTIRTVNFVIRCPRPARFGEKYVSRFFNLELISRFSATIISWENYISHEM